MKVVFAKLSFMCVSVIVMSFWVGGSSAKVDLKTAAGMWLFDEGTGTQARDSSGEDNHGKLMNGPKWVKGKFGGALEFDGVDDIVVSGSKLGISGNAERTTAFWIRPTSSEGFQLIVAWGQAGDQKAYWAEYNGNQGGANTIRVCGYDGDIYTKSKLLPLNQWHHVAAVYPGKVSETKLYYNGVSQEILLWGEEALNTVDTPVTIGDAPFLHGINRRAFEGAIDEVATFNVALTKADIRDIMKGGLFQTVLAVSPAGKLSAAWGAIKHQ